MATSNDLEGAITSVVGAGKMAVPMFLPGEDVEPPYVYLMPSSAQTVFANDVTWIVNVGYELILCTHKYDRDLMKRMAQALETAGIGYEVDFSYDMEERIFMVIFSTDEVEECFSTSSVEESEDECLDITDSSD